MSVQLLDKTRKINKLLHNNNSHKVVFNDICLVLSDILGSNILVISRKGKVLGIRNRSDIAPISELIRDSVGGYIDVMLNERLLNILSTKENVNLATLGFDFEHMDSYRAIITPIDIAGERLGTLFLYKNKEQYSIDDIILSEYGTTVVGLEMMRSVNEENAEENRKIQIVRSAISTLSFSELEAITHIPTHTAISPPTTALHTSRLTRPARSSFLKTVILTPSPRSSRKTCSQCPAPPWSPPPPAAPPG